MARKRKSRKKRQSARRTALLLLVTLPCVGALCYSAVTQPVFGLFLADQPAAQEEQIAPPAQVEAPAPPAATAIDPDDWNLFLISERHYLPEDFTVDLAKVEGYRVDARIADQLKAMLKDARQSGVQLQICSAYRSVPTQTTLYARKCRYYRALGYSGEQAQDRAARIVARPGASEHHTGLAIDLNTAAHPSLDASFANTQAYAWLSEHAWEYGFIQRYAKEKEGVTGIEFEPWHYRFVGVEHAQAMRDSGQCLEEYLQPYLSE